MIGKAGSNYFTTTQWYKKDHDYTMVNWLFKSARHMIAPGIKYLQDNLQDFTTQ